MMRILVLMAVSGPDRPLRMLAERSLKAERKRGHAIFTRVLDGRASHGAKLDYGKILAPDYDLVVTMDSDCVVFRGWAEWITRTLADPMIGACGAPAVDKPGLHPSMLAMRSADYIKAPSFEPTESQDTGAAVCTWIESHGLYLQGATVFRNDWWRYWEHCNPEGLHEIWWHLGSGTASAWPGWTRQLYRTWKGWTGSRLHKKAADLVWRRRRFMRAAEARLR